MVKKILIWAHFWTFMVLAVTSSASESGLLGRVSNCDYPAPEGFQIVSHSLSSFSFAWRPSFNGATYSLGVETSRDSLVWTPHTFISSIQDTTIEIQDVPFESFCRFYLSVDCEDGGTSFNWSNLFYKFIIDLDMPGYVPNNPTEMPCSSIQYKDYEWLGFKISRLDEAQNEFNFFEVKIIDENTGTLFVIDKVYNTIIYATDGHFVYPPPPVFLAMANPIFQISRISNPLFIKQKIGDVKITVLNGVTFSICPENYPEDWGDYRFKFYGIKKSNGSTFSINTFNRKAQNNKFIDQISINTLIDLELNIVLKDKDSIPNDEIFSMKLFDVNGFVVLEKKIAGALLDQPISVGNLIPGFYFLQIRLNGDSKLFKIIKV